MIINVYFLSLAALCLALSAGGTWAILPVLRKHVMDMPNARSNHMVPVPRGGGIAMIGAALVGLILADAPGYVIVAALLLGIVSFMDDMRGLPARVRLLAQVIAVVLAIGCMPGRVFPTYVPLVLELATLGLAWIWYINLTNFMDGIDGISAMEAIMICVGIALLHGFESLLPGELVGQTVVMASVAYGFYLFNRSPAKLFMGDVGSIPLGFLIGWLLLNLAADGYAFAALILPAYYVSDATFTLMKRLLRGEKVWEAHSEHAYQKAARAGLSHHQIVSRISWLNAALVGLALTSALSMMAGVIALLAAYGITFRLIRNFTHVAA